MIISSSIVNELYFEPNLTDNIIEICSIFVNLRTLKDDEIEILDICV